MTRIQSLTEIVAAAGKSKTPKRLLLIGGCSRSGKSTLAHALQRAFDHAGQTALVLSLDRWIVSLENRKPNSLVVDRYDGADAVTAIRTLLRGERTVLPQYDVRTRKRLAVGQEMQLAPTALLLVEGVLALAYPELCQMADASIYVDVNDEVRRRRFIDLYVNEKGLHFAAAQTLLAERDAEEIPFIKSTRKNAKWVYSEEPV